ncbi:hypothetical protein E4L96_16690 [Massilia arenosa]|uniref:Tetratricopeptide repeat protein n=1 Tax=Zemynaea arenosa TaxID=2561931 RepID=A0A4Y9S418_9BURK|nr:hypothetical protein [Massilia arenosa]TFW16161.1 hypothetical protein E4L96_16690 [Massilia arenosa]
MIECDMLIAQAKAARAARDLARAAVLYGAAVQCLRHAGEADQLAHTLRHFGDVLLDAGDAAAALAPLEEALHLRRADDAVDPLELANTLRPLALAYGALHRDADCIATWREARDLYAVRGIRPGIDEANRALSRLGAA